MAGYRVFFLGHDDHIEEREEYEAADDAAAIDAARVFFQERGSSFGFEVWRLDRLVHREVRYASGDTAGRGEARSRG